MGLLELPPETITQIFRYAVVESKTSTTSWLRTTVPLVYTTTKDVRIIYRASTDNLRICKALLPNVLDSLTFFIHIDSPEESRRCDIRPSFLETKAAKERLAKIRHCKLYITSIDFDPTYSWATLPYGLGEMPTGRDTVHITDCDIHRLLDILRLGATRSTL
jgi:hypothetical protein